MPAVEIHWPLQPVARTKHRNRILFDAHDEPLGDDRLPLKLTKLKRATSTMWQRNDLEEDETVEVVGCALGVLRHPMSMVHFVAQFRVLLLLDGFGNAIGIEKNIENSCNRSQILYQSSTAKCPA